MRTGQVLVTRDASVGQVRRAQVVEVLGENAGPPFLVRWLDTGGTTLLYPDNDVWPEPRTEPGVHVERGNRCG